MGAQNQEVRKGCVSSDVDGNSGRKMLFNTKTGRVLLKKITKNCEQQNRTQFEISTMKILIAEDDFNSCKPTKAILSDYGDCETAEDGEKAV